MKRFCYSSGYFLILFFVIFLVGCTPNGNDFVGEWVGLSNYTIQITKEDKIFVVNCSEKGSLPKEFVPNGIYELKMAATL